MSAFLGEKNPRSSLAALALVLVLALLPLGVPSRSLAGDGKESLPAARIQVSFKLDPRLAGPTYGGARWVSPPVYSGARAQASVEVRASAVDPGGRPVKLDLEWTVSDPAMLAVSPARGEEVAITARRAGESVVTVRSRGASRKLTVKVVEKDGIRQVSIHQ
jgi:hypothetical protein